MRILNFGSCNLDYVYDLDHIVVRGETLSSSGLEFFSGGKGLNQSIAVAKAGGKVFHAGCIGADGNLLETELKNNGVDVMYLKKLLGEKTGHAIIQRSQDGENAIVLYRGCNGLISPAFVDEVLGAFTKGDLLLLQNEINNVDYIIEKAYARGIEIVFNPAPFNQNVLRTDINKIRYLILNEIEAQGLGGKSSPEENIAFLTNKYPRLKIILTIGKRGSLYAEGERILRIPSFLVEVKDTTAAGDTFIGFFIACLAGGRAVEEALKIASAAAAITVSRKGAATSIPFLSEVEEKMAFLIPNTYETFHEEELRKKISVFFDTKSQTANVSNLAKELGYSVAYTGRLVKKLTGKSFSTLLTEKRFEIAAKLLKDTDLSVAEIAYRCGYENCTFFRATFKQKYGSNPLDFRKNKNILNEKGNENERE